MTNTTYTTNDIETYKALAAANLAAEMAGKPSDAEFDMILMEKRIERDHGKDGLAEFLTACGRFPRNENPDAYIFD